MEARGEAGFYGFAWTFFASVGLIQFASLLGRRCTGVSLIELFHLAALAHLVLFLSPILFAGCLP
jgi:hypothetical protein